MNIMNMSSAHQNTKKDVHLMASNRKRSSRGTLDKGADEGAAAVIQDCNEHGERYEWIDKSNSTSTVRRNYNKSQYRIQITQDLKHLTKRCGCGDFRARHKSFVPESGEEADDEESAWSQFSPRSPPTVPEGLESLVNVSKEVTTTLQTSEIGRKQSPRPERNETCHSSLPVAKQCVTFNLGQSQVPPETLGKKVEKRHSLPGSQLRRSVEKIQLPCVSTARHDEQSVQRVIAREKCHSWPVGKRGVKFNLGQSQVPPQTLGKKVDKIHSLPNTQLRRSVGQIQLPCVSTARHDEQSVQRVIAREKCHSWPVGKQCVKFNLGQSQVPPQTLGKKVDKIHSLPNTQLRRSVGQIQLPYVSTGRHGEQSVQRVVARSRSRSPASLDSASSDLSGTLNTSCTDGSWNRRRERPLHPCTRVNSAPLLELEKTVTYDEGDQPSTTVTFKGHVPAELLNDIFFGRLREYSCPCWPQYDVDPHIGCVARSGANHMHARSALSEHGRRGSREKAQLNKSDVCVKYATTSTGQQGAGPAGLLRLSSQPDQRRHATTAPVRFRSEPSRERPHRANSPTLRRASEVARRPMSTHRDHRPDKQVHYKRKIIIT